jgi:hypothetical protein
MPFRGYASRGKMTSAKGKLTWPQKYIKPEQSCHTAWIFLHWPLTQPRNPYLRGRLSTANLLVLWKMELQMVGRTLLQNSLKISWFPSFAKGLFTRGVWFPIRLVCVFKKAEKFFSNQQANLMRNWSLKSDV